MGWIARVFRSRRSHVAAEPAFEGDPFAALEDPEPRRRWEAAAALGEGAISDRTVTALAQALGDPEPFVRWQAGQSLVTLASGEALRALGEALGDPSPLRRAAAAEALGQSYWDQAVPLLAGVLSDEDAGVRVAAALALGRLGWVEGVDPLASRLEYEPSPGVRWAIARALGMIGTLAAAEPLYLCLVRQGEQPSVRRSAAWALGRLSWQDTVVEGLLVALDDPDPQVRWHACLGLGAVAQTAVHAGKAEKPLLDRVREALAQRREDGANAGMGLVGEAAAQALAQIDAGLWARRSR